ncbi:abhydrolase domain-containing protein 15-like [Platysternon megacephalum]|uniref:Abhydrolase domain-containing protein 15-like n=1 Tax=Platysternon megacephalum TaxID=55544 RepID=A0A4D9DV15_9SAUR|nr:abhydrolase domain-containing protein 15-like [Platysternon megacephalum]
MFQSKEGVRQALLSQQPLPPAPGRGVRLRAGSPQSNGPFALQMRSLRLIWLRQPQHPSTSGNYSQLGDMGVCVSSKQLGAGTRMAQPLKYWVEAKRFRGAKGQTAYAPAPSLHAGRKQGSLAQLPQDTWRLGGWPVS